MEKNVGKKTTPTTRPAVTKMNTASRNGENGNEIRQIKLQPIALVEMRHIVDSTGLLNPKTEAANMQRHEAMSTATEAGTARLSTLTRKLPLIRDLLGSSASTKLGNPMQKKLMSVIVMGWKG